MPARRRKKHHACNDMSAQTHRPPGDSIWLLLSTQSAAFTALATTYCSLISDAPVSGTRIRIVGFHAQGKQKIAPLDGNSKLARRKKDSIRTDSLGTFFPNSASHWRVLVDFFGAHLMLYSVRGGMLSLTCCCCCVFTCILKTDLQKHLVKVLLLTETLRQTVRFFMKLLPFCGRLRRHFPGLR